MKTPRDLLVDLVALPGPPGQEGPVRDYVAARLEELSIGHTTDPKGNLLAWIGERPERPRVVVTAHLDEIALMVTNVHRLSVAPLGGVHPWKWGEGPVEILGYGDPIPAVLSFGSVHTTSPRSVVQAVREGRPVTWDDAHLRTFHSLRDLSDAGVRPGTRVVMARSRRQVWELGSGRIGSYFLDDRADLVAWLLALAELHKAGGGEGVLFAATASEELGGHGALYLLQQVRPEICVALEIGPSTPEATLPLDEQPVIWVSDGYAPVDPRDLDLASRAAHDAGLAPHFIALSRGGSDASCAAALGLCARPVTFAFAADNSHGFEIMHADAPRVLAALTLRYLHRVV